VLLALLLSLLLGLGGTDMCFLGPILFISFHPEKNESEKKRITIEAHPPFTGY
jgi:hypothetical protein